MPEKKTDKVQYLCIVGMLLPDNRLQLRPGALTTNPEGAREDRESSIVARLLDDEENELLRFHVPAGPLLTGSEPVEALAVVGKIPFPPKTRFVNFYKDEILLDSIHVSKFQPKVVLKWTPRTEMRGKSIIAWEGSHPENLKLHYFLSYTHDGGKTWRPLSLTMEEMKQQVDLDLLPGGSCCRFRVEATDGVNTIGVASKPFSLPIKPCLTMITSPEDGAAFTVGQPVFLCGQGFYAEENKPELEQLSWISSKDGELGKGPAIQTTSLSPGKHMITLTAGKGKRAGKSSVKVTIEDETGEPTAEI